MKWPWVSRAQAAADLHYAHFERDTYAAMREQDAAAFRREREMAAERYDALLEKFTALRVAGAVAEPPTSAVTATPAINYVAKSDELRDLIHERTGGNLRVRGLMLAQLRRDRADGVDPEEIQRRIEQGVSSDGVPA